MSEANAAGKKTEAVVLVVVLVMSVGMVAWGVGPDVTRLDERQETYISETGASWLLPRYWQQGYLEGYP